MWFSIKAAISGVEATPSYGEYEDDSEDVSNTEYAGDSMNMQYTEK